MPDSSALALIPRGSLSAEMVKNNGDLKKYHNKEIKMKFSGKFHIENTVFAYLMPIASCYSCVRVVCRSVMCAKRLWLTNVLAI